MLTGHAETIADAYDLGVVIDFSGPAARGELGEVWRLDTDRGVWAIKRSYEPFAAADAQRVGAFQSCARRHGVPAPDAVPTRDGRYGYEVTGTLIRVQSWVEVDEPHPMIDPALVGAAVAALHRTPCPADGHPHYWNTEPVGADGWDEILTEARQQRAPFADRLAALLGELLALESLLIPMVPVQTCHLDLWADNLRATPHGGLCILDWDNCGFADPSRELAMVIFEFARTSPERISSLYEAYLLAGGPGRVRDPTDFSMLIAQLGHIGARQLSRWLDPELSAADRSRALAGVDEFLDDPLLCTTLEEILTVTRGMG